MKNLSNVQELAKGTSQCFTKAKQKMIALVKLDLSAAFDTIDHAKLLARLKNRFEITGPALKWFSSYLTARSQSVLLVVIKST